MRSSTLHPSEGGCRLVRATTPSGQAGVTIMSVGDESLPVKASQTVNQSINISGVRPHCVVAVMQIEEVSTGQHTSWRGHISVRDDCQTRHLQTALKISGLRMVSVQTAYLQSDSRDNSDQRSSWPQSSVSEECQRRHLHTVHCLQKIHPNCTLVSCGGDSNHNDQHKLAGGNILIAANAASFHVQSLRCPSELRARSHTAEAT